MIINGNGTMSSRKDESNIKQGEDKAKSLSEMGTLYTNDVSKQQVRRQQKSVSRKVSNEFAK